MSPVLEPAYRKVSDSSIASKVPLVVRKFAIKALKFVSFFVNNPEFYGPIVRRHEAVSPCIVKTDVGALLVFYVGGRLGALAPAFLHIPANQLVAVIFAAE